MAQRKRWDRYSIESLSHGEADPLGRIFLSPIGQENHDLVHFLHHGIDTAKQLYNGTLRAFPLEVVETAYDAGFRQVVEIEGYEWLIGSGRAGGYRYTLRNSDLGVIVLLGSNFVETDKEGSHLKIELSPHYLIPGCRSTTTSTRTARSMTVISISAVANTSYSIPTLPIPASSSTTRPRVCTTPFRYLR